MTPKGISLTQLPRHKDSRGCLIALEKGQSLPFKICRVFIISEIPEFAVRGEHASSAHHALVILKGNVNVYLDNGEDQWTVPLSCSDQVLCVHAGVKLSLRGFSREAILLMAASLPFKKTRYFKQPQSQFVARFSRENWT
jgi:hypothetical protein